MQILLFELEEAPGVPLDDVTEVSNYVAALNHGMQRLNESFPLSNRLIREMHAVLLQNGRGNKPYFHKVGVAPIDGICSTDIVVLAPRSKEWFGFVLGQVSSVAFVEYANAGSTGTKMPRTSWTEMARYEVVLPPEPVAKAFTELVQPLVERIVGGIHESRTLADLRNALLPKLISGELRVEDAERFLQERGL
ncbi:hypothetical protein [Chloracidobacterium validum]